MERELPVIPVACGVLRKASGEVLLAQRPQGRIAAGYWEFPGGKIEAGETAGRALVRELGEELGVIVQDARPLISFRHRYSDREVWLDTWLVQRYTGEPRSCEGQELAWVRPEHASGFKVLPTVLPILPAVCMPDCYVFTRPDMREQELRDGLPRLPPGALLRLRLPLLDEAAYARLARRLLPDCRLAGLKLILDRAPVLAAELGADGWHASTTAWRRLERRPLLNTGSAPQLLIGSAHRREELEALRALGADAAVLGHVGRTATHPDAPPLGWPGFAEAARWSGLPVYAIGGLGPAQRGAAWAHGGQGVAGISAFWG